MATQAGKGFFRRQEVQDLIALTRVLADSRDTLAFGALMRGPLVGLTEEDMLDIVGGLPRAPDAPGTLPRFDARIAAADVVHPLGSQHPDRAPDRRNVDGTTPYDILSQAVDMLRVRPTLLLRHGGQAERALANVELFLGLSRPYAVRGLRTFAAAMTAAWPSTRCMRPRGSNGRSWCRSTR